MKHPFARTALLAAALCLVALASALAKPPQLKPGPEDEFPNEVRVGQSQPFHLSYQQPEGDAPKALYMIVQTPGGDTVRVPGLAAVGDPTTGVDVTWTYKPLDSGVYHYHFEATSATGDSAVYPEPPARDLEFDSVSIITKWIIFLAGLAVALFFLPFIVYVAARAINKRGAPATAATVALLIGVLASFGLYLYLFWSAYGGLGIALAAIAALAILILIFTRH